MLFELVHGLKEWDLQREAAAHRTLCWLTLGFGIFTLLTTVFVVVPPYGRHETKSKVYGFKIHPKVAWIVMESPALLVPLLCLGPDSLLGHDTRCLALPSNKILLGCFMFHYLNRAIIFPLRMRGGKPMPFGIMFSAFFFCCLNGYLQGRHLTTLGCVDMSLEVDTRLNEPHFYLGLLIYCIGWLLNYQSDDILRNLRKPGETGYKIPRGGLFEYVSGANFASETLEWAGFALAANSLPALTFAIFTACNVGPRAVAHHRWYLEKFNDEYPASRKAYIPFLL